MFLAIIGYILVVIAVFGRALLPPDGLLIFGDDIHRQYYFFREFFNYWIRQGVFPWWNPYLFGGQPYIADPMVNIWYPPNWLFVILPLNLAYSWHLALHIFWAMLGMYNLNSKFKIQNSKLSSNTFSLSAWVGGLIFGLSGFFMARVWAGHVDVIAAASWLPWVVHAFYDLVRAEVANQQGAYRGSLFAALVKPFASLRVNLSKMFIPSLCEGLEKTRRAAPFGYLFVVAAGTFAIQLLAGYQTMAFFTAIAVFIVSLIHCFMVKNIRPLYRVGFAGFAGIGLAAFHLLPVQEFFRQSIRTYSFPYLWHSYGAIEWRSLLQLLNPFQFGNQYTYSGPPPNFVEHSMFVGVGGLVLALIGIIEILRRFVRAEVGVSWFSRHPFGFAQGKQGSVYPEPVEGLETKHLPARSLGLAFVLVVLFGIWVSLGPNAPVDLQYILWKLVPMYHYLRIPSRHLILVVFGLAGLVGIGMEIISKSLKKLKYLKVLIGGIIVTEMVLFGRGFIELRPVPEIRHDKELISMLTPPGVESRCEPYRLLQNFGVWIPPRDSLDFDSVMSYRIFSATGYDPSILRNYYEFIAKASGKSGEEAVLAQDVQVPYLTPVAGDALDFLNIRYLMVPPAYDPFGGNSRYRLLKEDPSQKFRLYENTAVLPRFFFKDQGCSRQGKVDIVSYTPNKIVLSVTTPCDQNLLSSEVWYPGWSAYLNGKEVPIIKTNNVFRTLFVPSGKHRVVYTYQPEIFVIGGLISATMLFALGRFFLKKPRLT